MYKIRFQTDGIIFKELFNLTSGFYHQYMDEMGLSDFMNVKHLVENNWKNRMVRIAESRKVPKKITVRIELNCVESVLKLFAMNEQYFSNPENIYFWTIRNEFCEKVQHELIKLNELRMIV